MCSAHVNKLGFSIFNLYFVIIICRFPKGEPRRVEENDFFLPYIGLTFSFKLWEIDFFFSKVLQKKVLKLMFKMHLVFSVDVVGM